MRRAAHVHYLGPCVGGGGAFVCVWQKQKPSCSARECTLRCAQCTESVPVLRKSLPWRAPLHTLCVCQSKVALTLEDYLRGHAGS